MSDTRWRVDRAEKMVQRWEDELASARRDLCREEGHDFGEFIYGTRVSGGRVKVRMCERCRADESVDVTEEEFATAR